MKIKKIIAAVTALVIVGGTYTVTGNTNDKVIVNAAEETEASTVEKDGIRYEVSNGEATLERVTDKTLTEIVIPDEVEGIPVVAFKQNAFILVSKGLISLKLGDNIGEIPAFSMEGFDKLESIELGKKTEAIGEYAFRGCSSLEKITFSEGLKVINHSAFTNCSSLVSLEFPDSLEKIDYDAFAYCKNLKSVKFGKGLEYLGEMAFYDDENLTDVEFGENIKYMGGTVFYDKVMVEFTVPESVAELDGCPVYGSGKTAKGETIAIKIANPDCAITYKKSWANYIILCAKDSAVEKFAEENNIAHYTAEEFESKENAEDETGITFKETEGGLMVYSIDKLGEDGSLVIPDEVNGVPVVSIYNGIMNELVYDQMKSLIIGNNIKSVPAGAFANCKALESVELGDSVETVENGAFFSCAALKHVYFKEGLKEIGNSSFAGCALTGNLYLPNSLETIGTAAFMNSGDFQKVFAGQDLKTIGDAAFSGNTSLLSVNLKICVKELGKSAFENCYSLNKINIPSSLESIREKTFYNTAIDTLVLGKNIKSVGEKAYDPIYAENGEEYTLEAANGSSGITVPAKKNKITVAVLNPECELEKDAFIGGIDAVCGYQGSTAEEYCKSIEGMSFYSIGEYSDGETVRNNVPIMKVSETEDGICIDEIVQTEGDTLVIPAELYGKPVVKIGKYAAKDTDGISYVKNLIIEGNVREIESGAFDNFKSLENAEIGEGLSVLDQLLFAECSHLRSVKLPDSLELIDNCAFYGLSELNEIQFGKGLKTIGKGAFAGCTSLTELAFPDSLEAIAESAFEECTSLTELAFPDSLEIIGVSAFKSCMNLTEIKFGKGLKCIDNSAFHENFELKKVTLNEGLQIIGQKAFESCYMLEEVNIPNTVTRIYDSAFSWTSIRQLVLPESVEYVGSQALWYIPKKDADKEYSNIKIGDDGSFARTFILPKYEGEVSVTVLNPECELTKNSFLGEIDNIYGFKGSTADKVFSAEDSAIKFVPLDEEETNSLAGDANCDGAVDLADAVIIMQALANPDKYGINGTDERHITAKGIENGDVDKNIVGITSNDALRIQELLLGKDVKFD